MPQGVYSNFKCTEKHGVFTPQAHQEFVREYFIKSPYKGLLLYHRLGSGKTCSSIIIGDALLKLKNIKTVYVLSPGSLRQGWIKEYCGGRRQDWIGSSSGCQCSDHKIYPYYWCNRKHSCWTERSGPAPICCHSGFIYQILPCRRVPGGLRIDHRAQKTIYWSENLPEWGIEGI